MKMRVMLFILSGFLVFQVTLPAGAVLQSKNNPTDGQAAEDSRENKSLSQIISNNPPTPHEDMSQNAAGPGNMVRIRMGLKPIPPSAQPKETNSDQSADPYALGTPKTAPPMAVVPDPVSPVVKTVSGPKQTIHAFTGRMRSTGSTQTTISSKESQ